MIEKLKKDLAPFRDALLTHEIYSNIRSVNDVRIFMEHHVFAVWDFMSLLKTLQNELTNTSVPWIPGGAPTLRRFINEIVLAEESDLDESNKPMSHFEMYIDAMAEVDADTSGIERLVRQVADDRKYIAANNSAWLSGPTGDFIDFTFKVIDSGKTHRVAAAFTFGRENLIPDMFVEIVRNLNRESGHKFTKLVYYIDRHIQIDADEHGPMSLKMLEELCGDDIHKWNEVIQVSREALIHRIALWDHINESIKNASETDLAHY